MPGKSANNYWKAFLFAFSLALLAGMPYSEVNLLTPANNAYTAIANNTFTFNFTSANDSFSNCTLFVDGTGVAFNETTLNNTNTSLLYTLPTPSTSYLWNVTCVGQNSTELPTETRTYTYVTSTNPSAVNLGTAGNFVVLAKSGISETGAHATTIAGNIGVSPAAGTFITEISCTQISNGEIYDVDDSYTGGYDANVSCHAPGPGANKTIVDNAVGDMGTAYGDASGRPAGVGPFLNVGAGTVSGQTLVPGVYTWGTHVTIPTDLTLDCQGNTSGVFIFQVLGNLGISSAKQVLLTNGCAASNIFWAVSGVTTLETTSVFNGNILSTGTSAIVLQTGATLNGRALSDGAVTLDAANVSASSSSIPLLVTPNSPAANLNTSNTSIAFNFTAISSNSTTLNCSLLIDGASNATNSSTANNTATLFTVSGISQGTHNWTVSCTDGSGSSGSSILRTFLVDTTAPSVALNSPANNTLSTNGTATVFNFIAADNIFSTTSCSLYLGSGNTVPSINTTNASTANNTATNITVDLANGVWTWHVACTDGVSNSANSSVRKLLVDTSNSSVLVVNPTNVTSNLQVIATPATPPANITMSSNATDVDLNLSLVYNSTTFIATLINGITVNATTSLGIITLQLPAGLSLTGTSDWGGIFGFPKVLATPGADPTDTGSNAINAVVQGGLASGTLTLSNAARIFIPGMAGKSIGYATGSTFTKITAACTTDSQAWADANVAAAGECAMASGSDLVIWTKHLTQFVAYTNTPPSSSGSGSSPNGGGSTSGGSASTQSSSDYMVAVGTVQCTVTLTRSLESETSKSTLATTLQNAGGEGCSMENFVFSDTMPQEFAGITEITFTPNYTSKSGQQAIFIFPGFAPGESKTLEYSVDRWARPSSVENFTIYSMSASAPAAAPAPGSDRDSYGCIPSAGYSWCEEKQKCLRTWEEECVPATPQTPQPEQPETIGTQTGGQQQPPAAPGQPQTPQQEGWLSGAALAVVAVAVLALAAAVGYMVLQSKKKKGR